MPTVVKVEGGRQFRASAYLVVPDATKPSTWKLRVEEEPGKVTAKQLGLAAAALSDGGLMGNTVGLEMPQMHAARQKLMELYGKLNLKAPESLREVESLTEMFAGAITGATLEEAEGQAPVLRGVTLIRAGESANRRAYTAEVLRRDGPEVFERAPAYVTNHNPQDKTIRNLVGVYENVSYDEEAQALRADLRVIEANRGLVETALEAARLLGPERIGLSIDTAGSFAPAGKGQAREVTRLHRTAQTSVDLVVNPAAGGRLTESAEAAEVAAGEGDEMFEKLKEMTAAVLAGMSPEAVRFVVGELTQEQVREANAELGEAIWARMTEQGVETPPTTPAPAQEPAREALGEGAIREMVQAEAQRIAQEAIAANAGALLLESRVAGLSPLEQEAVRGRFHLGAVTEAALETEIARVRDLAGRQHPNRPAVPGVTVVAESLDYARARLQAVISQEPVQVNGRAVAPFRRFSEAVCAFRPELAQLLVSDPDGFAREALGCFHWGNVSLDRAAEAVEPTTFAHAWADALNRVLVSGPSDPSLTAWRQLVSNFVSFRDLTNSYKLVQTSEIGNFPTVGSGGTYQEVGAYNTDRQQTLTIDKKGGLYAVTYEAILLDDIGVLRDLPRKINLAWNWTIADVVFGAIQGSGGVGPTMAYDSKALYHTDHGNLGSSAFSAAALIAARLAMKKQADPTSGHRKLYTAKYLLYSLDLEQSIWEALEAQFKVGLTSNIGEINVPNFIRERLKLEPIEVDYPTATTTRWELCADPAVAPTLAVGFLFGRDTPNVVIADQATSGSMFTSDKVVYKCSGTVGAAPIEHRAWQRGQV